MQSKQLDTLNKSTSSPKRLVITVGDARVGKSTIARLLLELYLESNLKVLAYYNGSRNKLYPYELLVPVNKLTMTRGGADKLLIDLERGSDINVAITDMPGQFIDNFKEFSQETLLFDSIATLGYRITFINPISHRRDCIDYLQELLDYSGHNADYVVVKNLYFGNYFPYHDGTNIQKRILATGGLELSLEMLWKHTYELVESMVLPYSEAIQKQEIDLMNRSRIFNWKEELIVQIQNNQAARGLLGLSKSSQSSLIDF